MTLSQRSKLDRITRRMIWVGAGIIFAGIMSYFFPLKEFIP